MCVWGGGGVWGFIDDKKKLSPQRSEKKFVENVGRKKVVNQNKPENGKVQNRENIRKNLIVPFFKKTQVGAVKGTSSGRISYF